MKTATNFSLRQAHNRVATTDNAATNPKTPARAQSIFCSRAASLN
jgi:hypothetical protein